MRKIRVYGLFAAIGMMAAAGDAFAAIAIDCSTTHSNLATEFNVTHPGGLADTVYQITGPCTGGFAITHDNITIEAKPMTGIQTIAGASPTGVTINGASNIELLDITIDGSTMGVNGGVAVSIMGPASVSITTSMGAIIENASGCVGISGPASVFIGFMTIQNCGSGGGGGGGVTAFGPARVVVDGATFVSNKGLGIDADEGSVIEFLSGPSGASISQSGVPVAGPAIRVRHASSVAVFNQGSSVTVTGPDNAPTIVADQNSSVFIDPGSTISTSGALTAGPAIVALQSSSVTALGATVNGPSANHTILAAQGSHAILNGSTVSAAPPFVGTNPLAVITATGSSSIALAGGNTITNSAVGGMAVIVSDGSSFIDVNGPVFGFTTGTDTVTGGGRIFTQSVIELATANLIGVDWTGNISAFAASSFRADGGSVTINGTLTLDQTANGYFNHQNGTTNNITSVKCNPVTMVATSHVSNPTFVTPNVTIGSPPGCLPL